MDLSAFLAAHGIDPACHAHPPVVTVAESERLVPPLPGAKTKNLFLRDRKGARHFLVTVPHALAVDLAALGEVLDAGRLGFGSPDRLLRHLGIAPGSVSLLALVNDTARAVEFVIDRGLWNAAAVQAHPLRNDATMVIAHADLEPFLRRRGTCRACSTPRPRARDAERLRALARSRVAVRSIPRRIAAVRVYEIPGRFTASGGSSPMAPDAAVSAGHDGERDDDQRRRDRERDPHAGGHGLGARRRDVARRRGEREHRAHHRGAGDEPEVARQVEQAGDDAALVGARRRSSRRCCWRPGTARSRR